MLFAPAQNFHGCSLAAPCEMLQHKDALLGLDDCCAYYGVVCDASYPTTMLAYWTCDHQRGPNFELPEVVRMLTSANADPFNFHDRGEY